MVCAGTAPISALAQAAGSLALGDASIEGSGAVAVAAAARGAAVDPAPTGWPSSWRCSEISSPVTLYRRTTRTRRVVAPAGAAAAAVGAVVGAAAGAAGGGPVGEAAGVAAGAVVALGMTLPVTESRRVTDTTRRRGASTAGAHAAGAHAAGAHAAGAHAAGAAPADGAAGLVNTLVGARIRAGSCADAESAAGGPMSADDAIACPPAEGAPACRRRAASGEDTDGEAAGGPPTTSPRKLGSGMSSMLEQLGTLERLNSPSRWCPDAGAPAHCFCSNAAIVGCAGAIGLRGGEQRDGELSAAPEEDIPYESSSSAYSSRSIARADAGPFVAGVRGQT